MARPELAEIQGNDFDVRCITGISAIRDSNEGAGFYVLMTGGGFFVQVTRDVVGEELAALNKKPPTSLEVATEIEKRIGKARNELLHLWRSYKP